MFLLMPSMTLAKKICLQLIPGVSIFQIISSYVDVLCTSHHLDGHRKKAKQKYLAHHQRHQRYILKKSIKIIIIIIKKIVQLSPVMYCYGFIYLYIHVAIYIYYVKSRTQIGGKIRRSKMGPKPEQPHNHDTLHKK